MFYRTYYTRSDMRRQGKFQRGRPKDENRKRYFRRKTQKKKKKKCQHFTGLMTCAKSTPSPARVEMSAHVGVFTLDKHINEGQQLRVLPDGLSD